MKEKKWLLQWGIIVVFVLGILGSRVFWVDPFFHYHKPRLDEYFYELNNERSQNDGIIKQFDYDAMITGTSMTQNFRSSEVDEVFGCNSIKVPFSGGSYKEINENIRKALEIHPNMKLVIRGLDMSMLDQPYDYMREDLGDYPEYLYDSNPLNDIRYLLNRDIVFGRVYSMVKSAQKEDSAVGMTSFDAYSRWQDYYPFGVHSVIPEGKTVEKVEQATHLSDADKEKIRKNIEYNVTEVADQNPEVSFYYFYTPYSIVWWSHFYDYGSLPRQLEVERYVTDLILEHSNIHLFSINDREELITDLNNYKDEMHYGSWINSLLVKWMKEGIGQIDKTNVDAYTDRESTLLMNYDYEKINDQIDYEADYYAGALLNQMLTGVKPIALVRDCPVEIMCTGSAKQYEQDGMNGIDIADGTSKVEMKVKLPSGYRYLSLYGAGTAQNGTVKMVVSNEEGENIGNDLSFGMDGVRHQYVIDLSQVHGEVDVQLLCNEEMDETFSLRVDEMVLY